MDDYQNEDIHVVRIQRTLVESSLAKGQFVCRDQLDRFTVCSSQSCPEYFRSYFKYVRSTHGYRTRSAVSNDVLTPSKKILGLELSTHSSACPLWNNFLTENSLEHFKINRTF